MTVDVEPGLDLFLVRADLWGSRPVPSLKNIIYRPFNIGAQYAGMATELQNTLLDYGAFQLNGSVAYARHQAQLVLRRLRDAGLPCLNSPEQRGKVCKSKARRCKHLFSSVCPETCAAYPPSDGTPLWMPNGEL